MLTKEYNCYFVLSSATIPLLYDGLDAVELCNGAKYFDGLDRTEINFSSYEKMDMDKLYGIVSESLESNP